MNNTIINAVQMQFGASPKKINSLGGGFYGRAFRVLLDNEPYEAVLKLYLFPDIAEKEALQTETLSRYSLLKMPKTYGVLNKTNPGLSYDVLVMEYIKGKNAGWINCEGLPQRKTICEAIVDNLISVHNAINPKGFGSLSAKTYFPTWQDYYYPIAESIVDKAKILYDKEQLSRSVMTTFEESIENFKDIFCLPINTARLVHGDYNTWNIMLNEDCSNAIAVIDPYNCCWADSEIDLYQLDNANGKEYGLLKRYAEKVKLSDNFTIKRCFYELYSEVCHYHDSGVAVDLPTVEHLAARLNDIMT